MSFRSHAQHTTGIASQPAFSIDVNQDSTIDLITPNYDAGSVNNIVTVSLGNGNTIFQHYAVGTHPTSVFLKIDLITANAGGNSVSVLVGNGNGTFQAKQDYAVGTEPTSLFSIDVSQYSEYDRSDELFFVIVSDL
ncbi:unnamed protein product [Didymodactylos carnosus]|uniref:Uncharacterized protein n=1 Tax=Didymodactylos carnosus TaxID=1234261 RepID=A0A8S2VW15_9BILA|nr:unnamed protein product [Didymodactylos carnosus]CAF3831432.1 unnamed protein product [Didymodactylos carnosus]CAF4411363.1 unnamed protein product [Didymodactylos carnosus]